MNDDGPRSRYILIAWITWLVSLFLPFAKLFGGSISGWQVVCMILSDPPRSPHDVGALMLWLFVFTNLIVLASPIVVISGRPRSRRVFRVLATAAAHLNAVAMVFFAPFLWYGSVVWLASFILLAWALWPESRS